MATVNNIDLGIVQAETNTKEAGIFSQPLVGSDSDETIAFDLFGVTRIIEIEGVKIGTKTEIQSFIDALEGLEDGSQQVVTFVSSILSSNKNIIVTRFRHTWRKSQVTKLEYSLDLLEAAL